jgi:hypothetical protein
MSRIRNFKKFLNEELEYEQEIQTPITRDERMTRPMQSPIELDDIDSDWDTDEMDLQDMPEEEEGGDVYIGTRLMEELADTLGTEIVDNQINYNGHTINFYSETEAFDVDGESMTMDESGKKVPMKTVEQVLDYLQSPKMGKGSQVQRGAQVQPAVRSGAPAVERRIKSIDEF